MCTHCGIVLLALLDQGLQVEVEALHLAAQALLYVLPAAESSKALF